MKDFLVTVFAVLLGLMLGKAGAVLLARFGTNIDSNDPMKVTLP